MWVLCHQKGWWECSSVENLCVCSVTRWVGESDATVNFCVCFVTRRGGESEKCMWLLCHHADGFVIMTPIENEEVMEEVTEEVMEKRWWKSWWKGDGCNNWLDYAFLLPKMVSPSSPSLLPPHCLFDGLPSFLKFSPLTCFCTYHLGKKWPTDNQFNFCLYPIGVTENRIALVNVWPGKCMAW